MGSSGGRSNGSPTRVNYRVKERETKERETWEHLSLSLYHQEKKKKHIGVPTKRLASDWDISSTVGFTKKEYTIEI